jgi:hypothetical protein
LSKLRFDVLSCLPTVRKRDSKQLADAHIFHSREAERAQRMLDGLPLRVENGRFEFDGDGRFHAQRILWRERLKRQQSSREEGFGAFAPRLRTPQNNDI